MAEQSRSYIYDPAYPTGWKPWDGSVSGGGGGGSGITQAEVQAAIEAATNLDGLETTLTTINGNVDGLESSASSIATNTSTTNTRIGDVTETAPANDTASSGLNGRLQRIAQRITSLIALFPSSLGQKTKTGSLAVTLASDQDALPITDNSGSLTIDSAQLPSSIGSKTAANSLAVALSTDGVAATRWGSNGDAASLTGSQAAQLREIGNRLVNTTTTYTHSSVSPTNTSTQVVAANSSRKHLIIVNRSTTLCYLQLGSTATTTNGIPLNPATISGQGGGSYEVTDRNLFTGAINAITSSGTATLSVMEGV